MTREQRANELAEAIFARVDNNETMDWAGARADILAAFGAVLNDERIKERAANRAFWEETKKAWRERWFQELSR